MGIKRSGIFARKRSSHSSGKRGKAVITDIDQKRLARLRADSLEWCSLSEDAKSWDSIFLLGVIDRLLEKLK